MDAKTLERLDRCRLALERNPNDRLAVLDGGRLLRDIGQAALGAELITAYIRNNAPDGEIAALAREMGLGGWQPAPPAPEAPRAAAPMPDTRRAPETFAEISGHLDTVHGWILKDQERFLFEKVKSLPDGAVIVEMGCCKGKSTVAMAFACIGTRKRIFSIDTFSGNEGQMGHIEDFLGEWRANLDRFGLERYATPLRGYTFEVVPDRTRYPAPDFVFIDASHEFTDVLEDFRAIYPYVKDGGWISFHDVEAGWPGPWRVWKDYAMGILDGHEYSTTLACGRKVAGRPFRRKAGSAAGFPFARELAREYAGRLGARHDLVRAMETSLEGRFGTREEREAILAAERRLEEAPEVEFHAVLKDMIVARDGRIDGHIRLWSGLSLLRQGKLEEARGHFLAAPRTTSPVPQERVAPYLDEIARCLPGASTTPPQPSVAARALQAHVGPGDTVYAIAGGDGAVLADLRCASKVGIEADRELRKESINGQGVDSLESWEDLPPASADVVVAHDLGRDESPLASLRSAFARLRPGGTAALLSGAGEGGALYAWNRASLEALVRRAGFVVRSVEPAEAGFKVLARRP